MVVTIGHRVFTGVVRAYVLNGGTMVYFKDGTEYYMNPVKADTKIEFADEPGPANLERCYNCGEWTAGFDMDGPLCIDCAVAKAGSKGE